MRNSTKRFISAMGSILDLCPAGSYSDYRSSSSDMDAISSDWKNVGGFLRDAVAENEPKKITPKANRKLSRQTC